MTVSRGRFFQSTLSFRLLRVSELAVVYGGLVLVTVRAGATLVMLPVLLGLGAGFSLVGRQIWCARLLVLPEELVSVGLARTRHIPLGNIAYVYARVTWYNFERVAVPVTLHVQLWDGMSIKIPGVQAVAVNAGLWRPSARQAVWRSYPQRVANEVNWIIGVNGPEPGSG